MSDPSRGFDCSGLVNWVVGHDLGLDIPGHRGGSYSGHGPTAIQWYTWSGAVSIPRDQCAPGDLVCWPGHIGIATSNDMMCVAPTFGQKVKVESIYNTPTPLIRRLVQNIIASGKG
jgi:cell wall-associated NlpC family hydrolase